MRKVEDGVRKRKKVFFFCVLVLNFFRLDFGNSRNFLGLECVFFFFKGKILYIVCKKFLVFVWVDYLRFNIF